MARAGSFSGPSDLYGTQVDVARPLVDDVKNLQDMIQMQMDQIAKMLDQLKQGKKPS